MNRGICGENGEEIKIKREKINMEEEEMEHHNGASTFLSFHCSRSVSLHSVCAAPALPMCGDDDHLLFASLLFS